ncbi:MAG: NAD(P)/FAD-dependent oxidoreductase [Parasporobacterium sp.]|nr:NAD(P)/FAD-dependent oxidoreductase [Parasporobacterium sp.]
MKILVIGGGPAGMMAAIAAADRGAQVILAEKNDKLGKKLYITGKGRCNITNACPVEEFFDNVLSNPRFLYSAVYSFDQEQLCGFLRSEGLAVKEERGQRIFPESDKSSDVIRTMERGLRRRKVDIRLNTDISDIVLDKGRFIKAAVSGGGFIYADKLVIATGGLSYRSTGSTGDGYRFAETAGHSISPLMPSLVSLKVKEDFVRELEGLSLRNVSISMKKHRDFGEMLFTGDGVSGPLILSASAALCREINTEKEGIPMYIDLKPALSEEQLDQRILRDFEGSRNKDFKNSLDALLPAKMIPVIVRESRIPGSKKVNEIKREERKNLVRLIKNFTVTVVGTGGFEQAVITRGGVNVREIDPSAMKSKKSDNIYFAGEVMDVDAYTGGFNLQIAWSTGYLAGISAAEKGGY